MKNKLLSTDSELHSTHTLATEPTSGGLLCLVIHAGKVYQLQIQEDGELHKHILVAWDELDYSIIDKVSQAVVYSSSSVC